MKKAIFGLGFLATTVMLVGCKTATMKETEINASNSNAHNTMEEANTVTKKEINDVQKKIEDIKAETLRIQMDKSLNKDEKAQKLEALQAELREQVKNINNRN